MERRIPPPPSFRHRIHTLLSPEADDPPIERAFNVAMLLLIVANVVAVCLQTVPTLFAEWSYEFIIFETFSVTIFSVELVLRFWSCPEDPAFQGRAGRLRFLVHPLTILDFLAILPFYLAYFGLGVDLRFARVVRLLRIFMLLRLVRYATSLRTLIAVLWRQKEELAVTATVGLVMLLLASGVMYYLEHDAQPTAFSSIPASLWWGVVTLATVGYGDVYPITPLGRLFGGLIAVMGVGLFALPAGIIASGFAEEMRAGKAGPALCPHCGRDPAKPPAAALPPQETSPST